MIGANIMNVSKRATKIIGSTWLNQYHISLLSENKTPTIMSDDEDWITEDMDDYFLGTQVEEEFPVAWCTDLRSA